MKRKNTILSLLLVLTMVVSTFAVLPMTAFAETTYPGGVQLFEDFESSGDYDSSAYEIGKARTAKATPGKGSTYISEEFDGLIVYQGNATATGTSYDYTTEGPDAKLIIEYDIYFEDLVETGSTFLMRLRDLDEYQKTNPLDMTFSASSIITTKATYDYQLQDDHWYHMRHIIKGTDSNTKPVRKHDLYIDGVAVITDGAFGSSSYYKFPKLDTLYLSLTAASSATETTAYMDNIHVYKANSTYSVPVDKGGLLAEIREAESLLNSGNYSEATKTAAQEQINIAKTVYTSSEATAEAVASAKTALAEYFENVEEDREEGDEEITYPGGVLMYESFTGIVATGSDTTVTTTSQPKGTNATIFKKRVGNDSGAGLGEYARQSDYSASSVIAEFDDASYFGEYIDDTTTVDEVAAQGPNARLTLEFDHKMESMDYDKQTADLRIMLGTKEMTSTMNSTGRAKSAASVFLKYPNIVNVYYSGSSADTYYLPDGMTIEQWHRYQLTLNLTDENSAGMSTFTFTVDGKNLVDADGNSKPSYETILDNGAITKAQLVSYYADVNGVDNVSVYKSNADNEALSTGALMTKLHEVNAKMALYRAAAEGTEAASQLAAFETAVANAGTMVTTAFGTYDAITGEAVTAAKTQDDVNSVLGSLEDAEASLKAVLPYYGISEHNIDENDNITAVTVEEIKAYTGSPVKLIVATFDTNGLSEVSMQDFTGAGEYVLTTALSVTDKSAEVYVWEMNDLIPLANTYRFGKAVVQD